MSKPKSKSSVKVNHPPASDATLATSNMPYSPVPLHATQEAVRPVATPKLRQLSESENVKIINPKGL